jgi:LacI family transcriptional regulator
VIGFLSDDIATTPFAVDIIRGAQNAALARGKVLLVMDTESNAQVEEQALKLMTGWQVEGVIYASAHHRVVHPVAALRAARAVLVDCFVEDRSLTAVVPDEVQGGRTATEALLASGRRRIGFINGPASFPASLGRLEGYRQALAAAGVPFDPALVREGDWWQESGYAHTKALMSLPDPPTALFCGNDWMAMGAYDALKELGCGIPRDIAVIGFDNREAIAAHMRPALTTIALPYYEMGQWAVEMLLSQQGGEDEPVQAMLECPLVRRSSV